MLYRIFVATLFSFSAILGGYYTVWYYSTQKVLESLPENLGDFFGVEVSFKKIDRNYGIADITTTVRDLKIESKNEEGLSYIFHAGDVDLNTGILQFDHLQLGFSGEQTFEVSDGYSRKDLQFKSRDMALDLSFSDEGDQGYYLTVDGFTLKEKGQELLNGEYFYLSCLGIEKSECAATVTVIKGGVDNANVNWSVVGDSFSFKEFFVPVLLSEGDLKVKAVRLFDDLQTKNTALEISNAYISQGDFWVSILGDLNFQTYDAEFNVTSSEQDKILRAFHSAGYMNEMKGHNWYVLLSEMDSNQESISVNYALKQGDLTVDTFHAGKIPSWSDLLENLWP